MPVASFSGLASGIDTATLISSLVRLERAPIDRLEAKKSDLGSVSRRLGEISKRTDALANAAKDLVGARELLGAKATSTDESKVRVSATGDATLGSFSVEVRALARAERTYSDGVAARDVAGLVGSGTLGVSVGGVATDVTIEATDTLDDVARKINESGADVTASVLNDGTSFRLLVAGRSTGAANAVDFTESGTTLGLTRPENQLVAARDASIVVDGLEITRATNRFSDVVPGVTRSWRPSRRPTTSSSAASRPSSRSRAPPASATLWRETPPSADFNRRSPARFSKPSPARAWPISASVCRTTAPSSSTKPRFGRPSPRRRTRSSPSSVRTTRPRDSRRRSPTSRSSTRAPTASSRPASTGSAAARETSTLRSSAWSAASTNTKRTCARSSPPWSSSSRTSSRRPRSSVRF